MNHNIKTVIIGFLVAWNFAFIVTHLSGDPIIVTQFKTVAMDKPKAEDIARQLLTAKSYRCWKRLALLETSTIDPFAKNSKSSAQGVGQLLTSTYRNLGMKHSHDEAAQTVAMLAYIGRKYGSGGPCAAYKFHLKHGYY